MQRITVMPQKLNMEVSSGENLLEVLRRAGCTLSAPCGGNGTCGKCRVTVDGTEVLACRTAVDRDMTVVLPQNSDGVILTEGISPEHSVRVGLCLALDIGTTTVAAYLTENGQLLACESRKNPQSVFGADVISRVSAAEKGHGPALTAAIRSCAEDLTNELLAKAGKQGLNTVCIVGNPAMQQLFLGQPVDNLTRLPFHPILTKTETADGGACIPCWAGATLLTVPDISAFIGADTIGCILATGMDKTEKLTLLVDIGTNGEMVLGNRHRLVACATAAGPALEGAGIRFGMQAQSGAIDHVDMDFTCHVIGEIPAAGICGSGLLDAAAVALDQGLINERGRIGTEDHTLPLADGIFLTQEDIRQLQLAKGAIAAGIQLMAKHLDISLNEIEQVYLAGGFGTFLDPRSACRIGLLPAELEDRIQAVGNAAGSGARMMACDRCAFAEADRIVGQVEHLDLAALPEWAKAFARAMRFDSQEDYWCKKALSLGFSHAAALDTGKLEAREDVRSMCAADKCGAYGKNHTCPPHCGTPEECQEKMRSFSQGILVQTVGTMRKTIDSRAYLETERRHLQQFHALADAIRQHHPHALCLGSGGCRICKKCAYPEPCRFPERACSSMEGYGLFVTQVCRDNNLRYHHGEKTITYTACILF